MKLITHFIDPGEASVAKSKLCAAGIMVEVSNIDPHVIQPSKSGAERIGLWVVFDDQLEDALLLLKNPDHVPQRRTSLAEVTEANSSPRKRWYETTSKFLKSLRSW